MIPTYDAANPSNDSPDLMSAGAPQDAPKRRTRAVAGIVALTVAVICLFVTSLLPSGFVIRQPGPVVNTLGEVQNTDGTEISLISMPDDVEVFKTDGTLSLTTVQVVGSREGTPNWFQLAQAWFDPSKAVMNIDSVFPKDQTSEDRQSADALMMTNSQHDATAAALTQLGYEIPTHVEIAEVQEDGAANGVLEPGDIISTIDGAVVGDALDMREQIAKAEGKAVTVNITRDGETRDVQIVPKKGDVDGETMWLVGVAAGPVYDLPIDVTIQLDNIGGPSAGMMFALGIIDNLTPGAMTGGESIAGTGTITPAGVVGPIGGIQQKLYGAQRAGADYFLAPEKNCGEVVGHVPDGLTVVKVATLAEAQAAVEAIATGDAAQIDKLASCSAK